MITFPTQKGIRHFACTETSEINATLRVHITCFRLLYENGRDGRVTDHVGYIKTSRSLSLSGTVSKK